MIEEGAKGSVPTEGDDYGRPMNELRDRMSSAAEAQKNRAADRLGGFADVARQTGERLRGQSDWLASWMSTTGDQIGEMAERLRRQHPAEIARDLTQYARQRPGIFLGGAFLVGLGLGRLMKAKSNGSGSSAWPTPSQAFAPERFRGSGAEPSEQTYRSSL